MTYAAGSQFNLTGQDSEAAVYTLNGILAGFSLTRTMDHFLCEAPKFVATTPAPPATLPATTYTTSNTSV